MINNLIVIPVEINGRKLSFILDTGVSKTIIFNLSENDSIGLLNPEKIFLRGLGDGEPVDAILSKNNKMKINGLVGYNESVYVILKDFFDLSSRMGTTIHGIIGYNLFKNFIVKINYKRKKIDFYNLAKYTYKKCRKCEVLPIQFYRKKPFVTINVQLDTIGNKLTKVKMLVDSGGSDAIWLFEDSKEEIQTPIRYFNDILGEGLSGPIYGNRSRIPKLKLGNFEIEHPTVSFLDTTSTVNARKFKDRNGSIGGNVLKRFIVWLDYSNRQIMLKKNGSFKKGFNYNMSGLDIIYNGKKLVKEEVTKISRDSYNNQVDSNNTISFVTNFSYKFKPSYIIKAVVKNSAGDRAGLKAGDVIISINRKPAHSYSLNDIIHKLQEKENNRIRFSILREGISKTFQFRLEKKI
ncbi:aspartyl protease family protein [uncultured Polaribacter sp.]|uniref:aspartyl protease family protein n=1 Tax=uncultured Polaribacter sp. TaxID=174711 RepID=UPI00261D6E86|nr:aspartyl protease family protein [uncultured Polaribacter sp.]